MAPLSLPRPPTLLLLLLLLSTDSGPHGVRANGCYDTCCFAPSCPNDAANGDDPAGGDDGAAQCPAGHTRKMQSCAVPCCVPDAVRYFAGCLSTVFPGGGGGGLLFGWFRLGVCRFAKRARARARQHLARASQRPRAASCGAVKTNPEEPKLTCVSFFVKLH
eukprot:SAG31_NODE_3083_length_4696_cov_3.351751_2_plen_162_part_00